MNTDKGYNVYRISMRLFIECKKNHIQASVAANEGYGESNTVCDSSLRVSKMRVSRRRLLMKGTRRVIQYVTRH